MPRHRARVSAGNTFGEIAREFIDKRRREGLSESTAAKSGYYISRMGTAIARLPIADIAAPELLVVQLSPQILVCPGALPYGARAP